MNPAFLTGIFWKLYLTLEDEALTEENIARQCEILSNDFTVRNGSITMDEEGEELEEFPVIEFPFFCGERYSLVIEYGPDPFGSDRWLSLVDRHTHTKHPMGWWDLARWHPYCLRLSELDALLAFWTRRDQQWPRPELPLLLLCQFVGLSDFASREELAKRTAAAFAALGLPQLSQEPHSLPALEISEGYRWEIDPERGWVFTGDEYTCYSLRNRSHADSSEGMFPFKAFGEMMAEIEARITAENRD